MKQPLIQIRDLHKRFGIQEVLRGASLSIYKGEITTIIGKSGGGKSVLLKSIVGLIHQEAGSILFDGKPLDAMSKAERRALKKKCSYMFQGTALFDSMTVRENIALPLSERTRLSKHAITERVQEKIEQLDLAGFEHKYPSQLSGGMKKRVALARSLVTTPEIVLFDEPTTGLDPIRKNAVHSMISDYQKRFGFTGVVVSHEIPDVFYISQRVAMLNNGRIIFEGSPRDIQETSDPLVKQFVRGFESRHDELTGMLPRTQGEQRFNEEMARLHRHQIGFSLLLLTIENIDEINQTVGHEMVQTAIRNFASQVRRNLYINDTCARHSMNQFMLVLPDTTMDQVRQLCKKLARNIDGNQILNRPFPAGFCLSISAGIAEARKDIPMKEVLARAESRQNTFYEFRVC